MGAAGGKSKLLQKRPDILGLEAGMETFCHGTVAGTVLERQKVWHCFLVCTCQKASLDYMGFLHLWQILLSFAPYTGCRTAGHGTEPEPNLYKILQLRIQR